MEKNKSQIKIEIDDDIGQGQYSNFAFVTHTTAEFIIDFISILPGIKKTKVMVVSKRSHLIMLLKKILNMSFCYMVIISIQQIKYYF